MATSIYATPPPDLSGEDTVLSDVSNSSSSINNRNNVSGNSTVSATTVTASSNTNTNTSNSSATSTSAPVNSNSSNSNENENGNNNNSKKNNSSGKCNDKNIHSPDNATTSVLNATAIATSVAKQVKRTKSDTLTDNGDSNIAIYKKREEQKSNTDQLNTAATVEMGSSIITNDVLTAAGVGDTSLGVLPVSQNASAAMAMAMAANAAMQLQLFEAINDAAKKRRKQNNPSRLEALNLSGDLGSTMIAATAQSQRNEPLDVDEYAEKSGSSSVPIDFEDKLSKMLLPKSMEHLKETFELFQQQQQKLGNISPVTKITTESNVEHAHSKALEEVIEKSIAETSPPNDDKLESPYRTFCKECGENFESDFKLRLHMLQEHNSGGNVQIDGSQNHQEHMRGFFPSIKVKMERLDENSLSSPRFNEGIEHQQDSTTQAISNGNKEQWLNSLPAINFSLPPEAAAAAALSAGGYLPLLGVQSFPSLDGLNRPPLRIFNPEAYCDLCNKEFCNKYFLKTHKANKHGIYDPTGSSVMEVSAVAGANASNSTINQIFQLQMQQQQQQIQQQQQQQIQQQLQMQQQQQQQQHKQQNEQRAQLQTAGSDAPNQKTNQCPAALNIPQQLPPSAPPPVFCDICSKRFTNVFAMRRHRTKVHEQPSNSQRASPTDQQQTEKREISSPSQQSPKPDKTILIQSQTSTESNASTSSTSFHMPEGFCQDFSLEQEEVTFTPQPRKLSPQSQQQAREANFAHDKLKRLGVVNPEAFCELCCKEYCNKYFLRTHKWKRHGIYMPPDDVKDEQIPTNITPKLPWPFMNMAATGQLREDATVQPMKRIKLEVNDDGEHKSATAEDIIEKSIAQSGNSSEGTAQKICEESPTQKLQIDTTSLTTDNAVPSPETVMGLQNLQKLQSMILQLNDINGKRPTHCHLCSREVENQYALQLHIMTEHVGGIGSLSNDFSNSMPLSFQQHIHQQQQALKISPNGSPRSMQANNELRCNPCDRDFTTLLEFKQHIADVHLLSGSPLRDGFTTPERPINPASGMPRPPYTITPTSSYCEICNKELCNKYFMKTHMQRMHGIEIENGAQIGGVVCNICNKELCSKYFLRVHKHNTHGIIEEGSPLPQPRQNGLNFEQQQQQQQQLLESELSRGLNLSPFGSANMPIVTGQGDIKLESIENSRFYVNWTEVCPICARRFRNAKWLRGHLLSDHGPAGIEKLRELEQQLGAGGSSKPTSPTLKIPNGAGTSTASQQNLAPNSSNLAQTLQNLNTQHLLANMPKNSSGMLPGMLGALSEQATLQPPRLKEYQCSICPYTTPYYPFLFIHERTHTMTNNNETECNDPAIEQSENPLQIPSPSVSTTRLQTTSAEIPTISTSCFINSTTVTTSNSSTTTSSMHNIDISKSPKNTAVAPLEAAADSTDMNKEELTTAATTTESVSSSIDASDEKHSSITSPLASARNKDSILDILNAVANNHQKVACYAVPKDITNVGNDQQQTPQQMQAFILKAEENSNNCISSNLSNDGISPSANNSRFVPAIIYLPVKERVSEEVTVTFTLRPT